MNKEQRARENYVTYWGGGIKFNIMLFSANIINNNIQTYSANTKTYSALIYPSINTPRHNLRSMLISQYEKKIFIPLRSIKILCSLRSLNRMTSDLRSQPTAWPNGQAYGLTDWQMWSFGPQRGRAASQNYKSCGLLMWKHVVQKQKWLTSDCRTQRPVQSTGVEAFLVLFCWAFLLTLSEIF